MHDWLMPTERSTAYELVAAAGHDVSAWANYKRPDSPSTNPAYCYNWAWRQGDRIVVTIWFKDLDIFQGSPCLKENFRAPWIHNKPNWAYRAGVMDECLARAYEQALDIKVIVVDGEPGDRRRLLDEIAWHVRQYDPETGDCLLVRGPRFEVVDQFVMAEAESRRQERRGQEFTRDPLVRRTALMRAAGVCQLCDTAGFIMDDGSVYLESHHIRPLSEGGADSLDNVAGLCANCHAKAHYAANRNEIAEQLYDRIGVANRRLTEKAKFEEMQATKHQQRIDLLRRKRCSRTDS